MKGVFELDSKQIYDVEITSWLTGDIYNAIAILAERNNLTLGILIAHAVENHILSISHIYSMAQFLNTRTNEEKELILKQEEKYPLGYRQFTNAQKKYPNAGLLKPCEDVPDYMKQLWDRGGM